MPESFHNYTDFIAPTTYLANLSLVRARRSYLSFYLVLSRDAMDN